MSRCDDGVFYRVCFATLLVTALMFTLILTNVFVDIDGLITRRERVKHHTSSPVDHNNDDIQALSPVTDDNDIEAVTKPADIIYNDMQSFDDDIDDTAYRTKRSLDSTDFQFHIKDPKMKNVLTNRLATLLEELDAEESDNKVVNTENVENKPKTQVNNDIETFDVKRRNNIAKDRKYTPKRENDYLHLAMHNILLQGMIGHMDLNDVYKKVHSLIQNETESKGFKEDKEVKVLPRKDELKEHKTNDMKGPLNIETQFLEELVNCDDLHKEIVDKTTQNERTIKKTVKKEPNMLIKTIIDITSLHDNKQNDTSLKENNEITGVIKLIYNGKSVKFNQVEDKDVTNNKNISELKNTDSQTRHKNKEDIRNTDVSEVSDLLKDSIAISQLSSPNSIINDALTEYFNKHADVFKKPYTKRMKRNVKVRQSHTTTAPIIKVKQLKNHGKNNEEELYVEIETHFDAQGLKGEKKQKLVSDIIDKIQKAIRSDILKLKEVKEKPKHLHIKKRNQNTLDAKLQIPINTEIPSKLHNQRESVLVNKFIIPLDTVVNRESVPISKSYPAEEGAPHMDDKIGEKWKKAYYGPHFLSGSKSINSAEMGELNINYEKDLNIAHRLQKPLHSGDEDMSSIYDLGNLKFYIKEFDGTGFSIGFNQYLGEPPDDDSIKTFTGIDSLLKTYQNQKYDDVEGKDVNELPTEETHEMRNKEIRRKRHSIIRRAAVENNDEHSNEYNIIFNNNFLPYDSYQEIFEDSNKKVQVSLKKNVKNETDGDLFMNLFPQAQKIREPSYVIDEHILEKELKPSEIFGLASLLGRRRRSIKVKKYSKVNTKSKLNRYINTNRMGPKRIFLKNKQTKRNKRQIDKIRILTGRPHDENVFLVSDENIFANRALVREVNIPDNVEQMDKGIEDNYEYNPYAYDTPSQSSYIARIGGRSRHNNLMSKYPHIFMEEISRSKEDTIPETPLVFNNYVNNMPLRTKKVAQEYPVMLTTTETTTFDEPIPRIEDIVDAISPHTNYKLTVKILPKNISGSLSSGFKEIHTSINKSISKNGLIFSSLVNMSEISKIEKILNQTDLVSGVTSSPLDLIKIEQEKMKVLLKQQKDKIDEQLDQMNKEKGNIVKIERREQDPTKSVDVIDVMLPSNPPQLLHLTKEEAGQLISSALMKLRDAPQINDLRTPSTTPITTVPTTVSSTIEPITASVDLEKLRMLTTIQHNENLTHRILSKIDRNTEMLQIFLQKLNDKLESVSKTEDKPYKKKEEVDQRLKLPIIYPTYWRDRIQEPFFHQGMPKLEIDKNNSHVSIPFVYAYQQPYPLPYNNDKANIASVIYQGHIHTNAIRKLTSVDIPNNSDKVKADGHQEHINSNAIRNPTNMDNMFQSNQTKFFIDSIEDDMKAKALYHTSVAKTVNVTSSI